MIVVKRLLHHASFFSGFENSFEMSRSQCPEGQNVRKCGRGCRPVPKPETGSSISFGNASAKFERPDLRLLRAKQAAPPRNERRKAHLATGEHITKTLQGTISSRSVCLRQRNGGCM